MHFCQKIPTKLYLGFTLKKNDPTVTFGNVTQFVSSTQTFETHPSKKVIGNEFTKMLEDSFKDYLVRYWITDGVEMNIFSETERWTWILFSAVIALLKSFTLYILSGQVSQEMLCDYKQFTVSKPFEDIYYLAKDIFILNVMPKLKNHINGTGIFAAMAPNIWLAPALWFTNQKNIQKFYSDYFSLDGNVFTNLSVDDHTIDYGIINFSGFYNEFYLIENYDILKNEYNTLLKYFSEPPSKEFPCIEAMNFLYFKMIHTAFTTRETSNNDEFLNNFIATITKIWAFQAISENYITLFREIAYLFDKNKTFEDEKLWLMPISSAKQWGSFGFVTKKQKSRKTLEKVLQKLIEWWCTTANFQYLSWIDGISNEVLKIEQYIDKNIYSEYITKDSVVLRACCTQNNIVGYHKKIIENLPDGIIFDTIDQKIYIDGEKVTHDDIPTQSGTIEIMDILSNNLGKSIHNKKFSPSSYSKNKNEMTGKIIIPLQKLIKKRCNKQLDLTCTGAVTDFEIILKKSPIDIYLIQKIGIFLSFSFLSLIHIVYNYYCLGVPG